MIVHEDNLTCGWGQQIAAYFAENRIYDLDAPVKVVAALDSPVPFTAPLENFVIPSVDRIMKEARELARV